MKIKEWIEEVNEVDLSKHTLFTLLWVSGMLSGIIWMVKPDLPFWKVILIIILFMGAVAGIGLCILHWTGVYKELQRLQEEAKVTVSGRPTGFEGLSKAFSDFSQSLTSSLRKEGIHETPGFVRIAIRDISEFTGFKVEHLFQAYELFVIGSNKEGVMRMHELGVPIVRQIAKALKVSYGELPLDEITIAQVDQALLTLTSPGGKFHKPKQETSDRETPIWPANVQAVMDYETANGIQSGLYMGTVSNAAEVAQLGERAYKPGDFYQELISPEKQFFFATKARSKYRAEYESDWVSPEVYLNILRGSVVVGEAGAYGTIVGQTPNTKGKVYAIPLDAEDHRIADEITAHIEKYGTDLESVKKLSILLGKKHPREADILYPQNQGLDAFTGYSNIGSYTAGKYLMRNGNNLYWVEPIKYMAWLYSSESSIIDLKQSN